MLKLLISIVFIFLCGNVSQAQSEVNFDSLFASLIIDSNRAIIDTANNDITLYLPGSIGCPPLSSEDEKTMEKYNFIYTCQGCTRFEGDNVPEYNRIMLQYLVQKYGRRIYAVLRSDIIGIEK